jgi:hypothetical protein
VLASRLSPCHLLNRPGIHQSIFIKGLKENTIAEEIIFLVEERQEGGYQAKALGDAIFTEADTMIKLKSMVKDAVACHFAGNRLSPVLLDIGTA